MDAGIKELNEQKRLLQIEYEAEKAAFTKLTEKIGVTRLADRGNAWFPIRVKRTYYNSLNQRILEIEQASSYQAGYSYSYPGEDEEEGRRGYSEEGEHNFEYGKPVSLFVAKPDGGVRHVFSGTVSVVDKNIMAVAISDAADVSLLATAEAGVVLSFDETTYRTMMEALDRALTAKGRLGQLRDLIYSHRKPEELSLQPLRFPYLNRSQEEGVNKVLRAKDVAIVHGPPGTGKTTTLVEAIHETLRRESQVLVCAQSNMAVDWICEKLTDRGIRVLRIGNPARVNDKMLSSTYERRFEDHPDYPTLWSVRKAIRELRTSGKHGSEKWHQKMDRLKSRETELEIRINNDLFSSVNVIASTLVGSNSRLLEGMKFSTLFIDEAAQALEGACWIPMRRAGRLVLAGDHCQLPPTVKSAEAMKGGLGTSLMERIVKLHPECVTLLKMQYRMHEDIMRFSSNWFYDGEMEAAPEVKHRGILEYDTPVEWVDTSSLGLQGQTEDQSYDSAEKLPDAFRESIAGDNFGRINRDEALVTLLSLQNYIEKIGKERFLNEQIDVGVISPYRAQVRYLRQLIKNTPFFKPFRRFISVNTVDGFQGQERDVIVISMVRSNDDGNIGFLRDLRRMNVAMTRARMKLIIIGDVPTLTSNHFYRKLYHYIKTL